MKTNDKKDTKKQQEIAETAKAWNLLADLIDGYILRDEAILNKKDFIEEAATMFKIKIIPIEDNGQFLDYFDSKRVYERVNISKSKKLRDNKQQKH